MTDKRQQKRELAFMKAYDFVMNDPNLLPAEKLVIIVVSRYWPRPSWQSNERIAEACGFSKRYVEKLVKGLADKSYIKRGYARVRRKGRFFTCRVIVPLSFPEQADCQICWIQTEPQDGQETVPQDGPKPNCGSQTTELQDDQLEKNRKENRNAAPAPLPAGGQAPALLPAERSSKTIEYVERIKMNLGIGKKARKALTEEEIQDRRQRQQEALAAV